MNVQARRKYLRDLLQFGIVAIVLVLFSVVAAIALNNLFDGKTPYVIRVGLALVLILVGVMLFVRMTAKSYQAFHGASKQERDD